MKVQHIRPKGYENLRAWCTDESNEYIGRRGVVFIDKKRYPEEDSVWANPYKIGKDGDRDEVLYLLIRRGIRRRILCGRILIRLERTEIGMRCCIY